MYDNTKNVNTNKKRREEQCRNLSYFAMSFFVNFRKIIAKEKKIWYYMESNNIATYVAIKF